MQDADTAPEMEALLESEDRDGPPAIAFGEKTPIDALKSPEFWLLFATSAITSGCGLTLLNNLPQMVSPAKQPR